MVITLLLILMLLYGAIYSFLPSDFQKITRVKFLAILSAIIILFWGIKQAIQEYRAHRFAYVSAKDGKILKKKNFPWTITKSYHEGNVVYIINERYGDATDIECSGDDINGWGRF